MLLKYNNLTIRNATLNDAEQLTEWWNDGKIMTVVGFPNGLGQTVQETVDEIQKGTDEHRCLIIELDNEAIGEMNYRKINDITVQLGIKICDLSRQNKGLGKIALSMLISTLFNDYGYHKVILDTDLNNKRAQHVYEQIGFTKLRVNRNSWTDQLGNIRSSVEYELYEKNFVNYVN